MINTIGWVPFFPLLGFILLTLTRIPRRWVPLIGCGSIGISAILVFAITLTFLQSPPETGSIKVFYGIWMSIGNFTPTFSAYVDALTLIMLCIITGVGFLIHVYSAGYMAHDPGYARYFAYLNLFIAAMSVLVLADNLVLLFLGWEGVGLCSYLLIGFWYRDESNGAAARKAFIVTRIGDTAMTIGFLLIFMHFSTVDIQNIFIQLTQSPDKNQRLYEIIALLVLGGAVGKSAQLPLQTWLPDAMAGPTPVSALIHAATMVTAGVYLIARLHPIYLQAPVALQTVGWIGLITLLVAGFSALVQVDIKRILAYSTISQIGYMFLGLGVGAWSASIFHLMTHAFFKALLFLSAGTVIFCLHHKQNIFEMGGLRQRMPLTFICFAIGCSSLASLPYITSGFYSKDEILMGAYLHGFMPFFWGGVLGALITAIYSFRLLFLVFFGTPHTLPDQAPTSNMQIPLVILAVLAVLGGAISLPLHEVLPDEVLSAGNLHHTVDNHFMPSLLLALVPLIGAAIAWWLYQLRRLGSKDWSLDRTAPLWVSFLKGGWAFDILYENMLVKPYATLARINRNDVVDNLYVGISRLAQWLHHQFSMTQTGGVRWYASVMVFGLALIISAVALL